MLRTGLFAFLLISFFGTAQSGSTVFDDSYIHEIRLTFDDTTFWDTLVADWNAVYMVNPIDFSQRKYVMASLIEIDGIVLDSVGFRLKGLSSGFTSSKRRHFKVDFGEFKDWKYEGLRKLNLSNTYYDGSMIKDALIYDWFRDMGVPAPRTSYFKLYLNNEYWGLYLAVEQVDKEFLEDNYVLSNGNLYKPYYLNTLDWHGPDWAMYEDTLELRTNEGTTSHPELYDFLEYLNTEPSSTFFAGINDVIDLDILLTHFAVDYFVSNVDSPFLTGRNYYLYADEFNGKMKTIPWDYNFSLENSTELLYGSYLVNAFDTVPTSMIRRRMEDVPEMRQLYFGKVCELGQTYSLEYFEPMIDEKAALIADQVLLEPHFANWMPLNETIFDFGIQALKTYFSDNANRISNQLGAEGFSCLLGGDEISLLKSELWPNPTTGEIIVKSDRVVEKLDIVNLSGEKVISEMQYGSGPFYFDCSNLETGIYFVLIHSENSIERLKFEKLN